MSPPAECNICLGPRRLLFQRRHPSSSPPRPPPTLAVRIEVVWGGRQGKLKRLGVHERLWVVSRWRVGY